MRPPRRPSLIDTAAAGGGGYARTPNRRLLWFPSSCSCWGRTFKVWHQTPGVIMAQPLPNGALLLRSTPRVKSNKTNPNQFRVCQEAYPGVELKHGYLRTVNDRIVFEQGFTDRGVQVLLLVSIIVVPVAERNVSGRSACDATPTLSPPPFADKFTTRTVHCQPFLPGDFHEFVVQCGRCRIITQVRHIQGESFQSVPQVSPVYRTLILYRHSSWGLKETALVLMLPQSGLAS